MPSSSATRRSHAQTRQQRQRQQRQRQQRQRLLTWTGLGIAAAVVVVVIVLAASGNHTTTNAAAVPTGPVLASTANGPTGQTVDGLTCLGREQLLFHVHAHLAVFVDGQPRVVPAGIGIPNSCYYPLHSHTSDGVIHIESAVARDFTLGNYFDVWGQPLDAAHVGPATGPVVAYLNGQRFSGDPRTIPLTAHALIQLDVGQDVAPRGFVFPGGL